eukprot:TRINITY_DN3191_c1_g1_i1.p1 TRINITY_DN3191_c1_g1~~TRINITY_DN3191_c1_g1_i1.p1  ORF type:complete len:117 (-),score=17.15 TRINITY_DN3191_c1_g1_i1:335-685(-)
MATPLALLDVTLQERVEQFLSPPPSPVRTYEDAIIGLSSEVDTRYAKTVKRGRFVDWEPGVCSPMASPAFCPLQNVNDGIMNMPRLDLDSVSVDVREIEEEYENYQKDKLAVEPDA